MEDLKTIVSTVWDAVKDLPEPLKQSAFNTLLQHELMRQSASKDEASSRIKEKDTAIEDKESTEAKPSNGEEDITARDIHVRVKRFLEKNGLTLNELNGIFYKDSEGLKPLYEDLKTTKVSESQIRLALLDALLNAITTGEFEFDGEKVREQCAVRKCYDGGNFLVNFKNNSKFFENVQQYSKQNSTVKLTEDGRKALASLIKELQ